MQITALTPTKRDPTRLTIKVDGRAAATLESHLIGELDLHVGQPWDEALAQRVAQAAAYDKAMRSAKNRLNRRMLSSGQLRTRLRRAEHEPEVIERVIERLTELGLLNDETFGRALIRETVAAKPAGPRLLRVKLVQRGLERGLIDRLLDEHDAQSDPEERVEQARDLAQRRLRSMSQLDVPTRKRRLWGLLARRGFDSETIQDALAGVEGLEEDEGWGM